ncbi:MAG TPA: di-heme oxidoredictase family protein, partial [Ignavibacteriaceae bacterium]
NLSMNTLEKHLEGDLNFEQNFVKAPAQYNSGLGPLFNNVSCINCHISDGRGRPPLGNEALETMLIRISVDGTSTHGGPNPVPGFGGQLQDKSVFGFEPEGGVIISYSDISGNYPDGTPYSLRKPAYQLVGSVPSGVNFSPRVAPFVFGLGLLEAISKVDILEIADESDIDGDGISGKPNYVWNDRTNSESLGRFGWKANQPNLYQQSAAAYVNDIGITNPLYQQENCHDNAECDTLNDDPEITDLILESVELYVQTLAVPGRRDFDNTNVLAGKDLFKSIGCGNCHTPEFTTGNHPISELSNQRIFPYTDLLLHDMGDDLADNRTDFNASGREWRTPPLWGIGLVSVVNGHTNFLHDGRARNLEEAILWHGGEANQSKINFMNMKKSDREKILKFLNSL